MLIRAQAKYPNDHVLCLPIYGWGDHYDPSASIRGGSSHCKSIAISPPHGKQNSLDNTFIVALIRKNKSHEEMEAMFREELLSLQDPIIDNWFYWKEAGKYAIVYAELFISLEDKPKQCGSMFFTLVSGIYSALWRHSCNLNAITNVMPSCGHCYSLYKDAISIGSS
jgi:hypothetical protein